MDFKESSTVCTRRQPQRVMQLYIAADCEPVPINAHFARAAHPIEVVRSDFSKWEHEEDSRLLRNAFVIDVATVEMHLWGI